MKTSNLHAVLQVKAMNVATAIFSSEDQSWRADGIITHFWPTFLVAALHELFGGELSAEEVSEFKAELINRKQGNYIKDLQEVERDISLKVKRLESENLTFALERTIRVATETRNRQLLEQKEDLLKQLAGLEEKLATQREQDREVRDILETISFGGDWLGAARTWLQSNVKRGDTLLWSSNEEVRVPFRSFERFARTVATAAVFEDREDRRVCNNAHQASVAAFIKSSEQTARTPALPKAFEAPFGAKKGTEK